MIRRLFVPLLLSAVYACCAAAQTDESRAEAAYYVSAYAQHYHVPVALVRSIVQQESGWKPCTVSPKGAVGLMQLMPQTARWLGVTDRCNVRQNIWGGVRYLAWLIHRFQGDLRLVAAAYYAGEYVVGTKGLNYKNPDVVAYVAQVRAKYVRQPNRCASAATLRSRKQKKSMNTWALFEHRALAAEDTQRAGSLFGNSWQQKMKMSMST
jgi:soluble lytic murein transglycosylase-like protein